jgi:tetratricopeptide (TPR) repeat protein
MSKIDFQNVLHAYVIDPHHPEKNFNLGCLYDFEGHSASALSFYLRTAELSPDPDLVYEALIRAALGFKKQGRRIFSTKSLLYHAINVRPQRPEAYWILSLVYELGGEWHEAHNAICLAEEFIPNKKPTRSDIGYVDDYVVLFQKAVTIWYIGGRDDARRMFNELLVNYKMIPAYIEDTKRNLKTIKG